MIRPALTTPPTPLEILSLAETRRRDPELALAIATQAGQQSTKENADVRRR